MSRFYIKLWFFWAIRVTIESLLFGALLAGVATLVVYLTWGDAPLDEEVLKALLNLFKFWFIILWNLSLLVALFRSVKGIFNHCHSGYKMELLSCPKNSQSEVLQVVGYGDLVKVWRKWFLLLIWLVASEMVIALAFTLLFTSYNGLFEWFNIYVLYSFILIGGYFSFMVLGSRCKQVRIRKC